MVLHTALFWLANQAAAGGVNVNEDHGGASSDLPLNVTLSNLAGGLSILCWFIVFTPQFWINYKRQSGESLSLTFLYIWLAGDFMNLAGATMDNLLLTMRILAWYYTIADILLIAQIFYYRKTSALAQAEVAKNSARPETPSQTEIVDVDETTPLIAATSSTPQKPILVSAYSSFRKYGGPEPSPPQHQDNLLENAENTPLFITIADPFSTPATGAPASSSAVSASASSPGVRPRDPQPPTSATESTFQRLRRRRSSGAFSTFSTASARLRKELETRKWIRQVLLGVLPILATAFFVWTWFDWLQCTIEDRPEHGHEGDGDGDWMEDCWRGRGHGRGSLPLPSYPENGGEDGFFLGGVLVNNLSNSTMGAHGRRHPHHQHRRPSQKDTLLPLLLGWGSAALYLGSRIPQILKNWRLKSCEGLSKLMFLFSVGGNLFYVASIFAFSVEWNYLWRNMPWWVGSGGTLIFDLVIFSQFYLYRQNSPSDLETATTESTETSGRVPVDGEESLHDTLTVPSKSSSSSSSSSSSTSLVTDSELKKK